MAEEQVRGIDLREKAESVPSQIKILGGPNNTPYMALPQLDLIDADENEVFTLELLRKLISESRGLNKDFLIARITTSDPNDQSVFYNYYYSAFEVNKILFKYESNRKLLHRMKVKNPLNNMQIIGQVSYYKITTQEFDRAVVEYYFGGAPLPPKKTRRAFSTIIRDTERLNEQKIIEDGRSKDTNDIVRHLGTKRIYESKSPEEIIESVRQGLLFLPCENLGGRKVIYDATYFASDDDFLLRADIREYFRRNTTDPEDDFLFELDRTNNDIFALLDTKTESNNEDVTGWKRVITGHMSVLMCTLCIMILFSVNPVVVSVAISLALIIFFSMVINLCYIMCCRRAAFDTLAVRSVEDV